MLTACAASNTKLETCSWFVLSLAALNSAGQSLMPSLCSVLWNSSRDYKYSVCCSSTSTKHRLLDWVLFATYLLYIFLEIVLGMLKTAPEQHMPIASNPSYLTGAVCPAGWGYWDARNKHCLPLQPPRQRINCFTTCKKLDAFLLCLRKKMHRIPSWPAASGKIPL